MKIILFVDGPEVISKVLVLFREEIIQPTDEPADEIIQPTVEERGDGKFFALGWDRKAYGIRVISRALEIPGVRTVTLLAPHEEVNPFARWNTRVPW